MTDKTILSTDKTKPKKNKIQAFFANKKMTMPAWMKRINGKEAAAFTVGMITYNVFYSLTKSGNPILEKLDEQLQLSELDTETINAKISESGKVATSVNDEMSFGEAFQASRRELGSGNFFWWNGRFYNNYTEEEWESLSDSDKAQFAKEASLLKEEDFDSIVAHSEIQEEVNNEEAVPNGEPQNSRVSNEEMTPTEEYEELEEPTQSVAYVDRDGDGKDDVLLINQDNDSKAEAMIDFSGEQTYALVDTGNTGMLDTLYLINEDGELHSPQELADEILAPKLPTEQMMDLIGNDNVQDSLAYDFVGDNRADRVDVDINADGVFDIAYLDTDGDGKLNAACKMDEDGKLSEPIELSEPFDSPEVDALVATLNAETNNVPITTESTEIAGLENNTHEPLGGEEDDRDGGDDFDL